MASSSVTPVSLEPLFQALRDQDGKTKNDNYLPDMQDNDNIRQKTGYQPKDPFQSHCPVGGASGGSDGEAKKTAGNPYIGQGGTSSTMDHEPVYFSMSGSPLKDPERRDTPRGEPADDDDDEEKTPEGEWYASHKVRSPLKAADVAYAVNSSSSEPDSSEHTSPRASDFGEGVAAAKDSPRIANRDSYDVGEQGGCSAVAPFAGQETDGQSPPPAEYDPYGSEEKGVDLVVNDSPSPVKVDPYEEGPHQSPQAQSAGLGLQGN